MNKVTKNAKYKISIMKIILCLSVLLNIALITGFIQFRSNIEDIKKQAETLQGTYQYDKQMTISFDESNNNYYIYGADYFEESYQGTYVKIKNNIAKLTSGKYKNSLFIKESNEKSFFMVYYDEDNTKCLEMNKTTDTVIKK